MSTNSEPSAVGPLASDPTFADPLWGVRLQVIWVVFTGIYALVADHFPQLAVSSLMIVIAGCVLLAVFAHLMVSTDVERIRRLLLVVLAASLFVINTAAHGFKDYLAAGFAGMFALMLGTIAWRSGTNKSPRELQYACFVSMSFAVMGGAIGLPATFLLKLLVSRGFTDRMTYLFAPQGSAAIAGLCVGLIAGGRILSSSIIGYSPIEPKSGRRVFAEASALSPLAGLPVYIFNSRRLLVACNSKTVDYFLSCAHMLFSVLPVALVLCFIHRKSKRPPLFGYHGSLVLVCAGLIGGTASGLLTVRLCRIGGPWFQVVIAQAGLGLIIGAVCLLSFWVVNRLSDTVLVSKGDVV